MADPRVTVLVVEDEEEVLDAEVAVRLGETHPGTIDLLITDVVMPRISGPELSRRLRAGRPSLRVLCMSGYPERADREAEGAGGWNAWLQKPFTPDGLIAKVRDCLTS
jgi:hypothetical protein